MRSLKYLALLMVAAPAPLIAQDPAPAGQTTDGYTIDFDNQPIQVVLSALAQAAGVNVVFGPLPDIQTTLRLGQPVPKEQLVDMMRQVAEGNGLVMRQTGSLIRIGQPDDLEEPAWDMGPPLDIRIYTYRLKYNNAAELAPVLSSLFTGASVQRSMPSGSRNSRRRGSNSNNNVRSVSPFSSNGASALARMLGSDANRRNSRSPVTSQDHIRIVAEEYTNTLLVRATPAEWEWIQEIIKELD